MTGVLAVTSQVDPVDADFRLVTGDYFRTLRIPLRSGRTFLESEEHPAARSRWSTRSSAPAGSSRVVTPSG